MKATVTFALILLFIFALSWSVSAVPIAEQEALVALYNSTDGPNWTNKTNWLTEAQVSEWYGVTVSGDRVTELNLNENNLSGTIPPEIGNLTNLTYLYLYNNQLTGSIPPEIGNLTNLTRMYLFDNQLTGSIPPEIGNLTNLKNLYLDSNQLTGSIPPEIGNMTNLTSLDLGHNQLSGSIPPEIGNMTNLTDLELLDNQLTGSIPPEIGNLRNLLELYLYSNQLTGSIPPEIGNLRNLVYMFLYSNQLTGSIPPEIGNLTNLETLNLQFNHLSGSIPPEIGNLSNLGELNLYDNELIDLPSLSDLTSLRELRIQINKFTFEDIEPNIGVPSTTFNYAPQDSVGEHQNITLNQGESLTVSVTVGGANNQYQWKKDWTLITGATDSSYTIDSANTIDAGSYICEITNTVATELTLYSRPINVIMGSSDYILTIAVIPDGGGTTEPSPGEHIYSPDTVVPITASPAEYHHFVNWTGDVADPNNLSTTVTMNESKIVTANFTTLNKIAEQDSLALVALYNSTDGPNWTNKTNWLTSAPVSEWYGVTVAGDRVTSLSLSSNELTGSIPPEIGDLNNLAILYLVDNQLSGAIPPEIGNMTNLASLYLVENQISGSIPSEIANLNNLGQLNLYSNQLTGSIPPEIGNMTKLGKLVLQGNQLTGSIPPEIGNMTNLGIINLSDNQLTGTIPPEIGNLANLTTLYSWENQLTGSIPPEIGNMTNLSWLSLHANQLTGSIPPEIGNLTNLLYLFLFGNQFIDLPDLSAITSLQFLKIENNQFTFEDIEPNVGIPSSLFTYAPQDSVGEHQNITLNQGESITVSVTVGGANNQYLWKKDGSIITGATDSSYTIDSVNLTDAGSYICEITNTVATDLTLYSRPINVEAQPYITVISPNGGESFDSGSITPITWESVGIDNVLIEFSADNGSFWDVINPSIGADEGQYNWQAPLIESQTCLVKISDAADANNLYDISDGVFEIISPPPSGSFSPTLLKLSAPEIVQYNFDGTTLQIPVMVSGTPANTIFLVYTKDLGQYINSVQNGYLGWHYVNKIDTCVYTSSAMQFDIGSHSINWDGRDQDGNFVPPGNYDYYIWGFDNVNFKIPLTRQINPKPWGKLSILTHNEDGTPKNNPVIYQVSGRRAASDDTTPGEEINRKWVIGSDPDDASLLETCITMGVNDRGEIGFYPEDYTHIFKAGNDNNGNYRAYAWIWVPNGYAVKRTDWGDEGEFAFPIGTPPRWEYGPGVVSDGGDYLLMVNGDLSGTTTESEVIYVDVEEGVEVQRLDLSDWYVSVEDGEMGGQSSGGPTEFSVWNGKLITGAHSTCMNMLLDIYWEDEDEAVLWANDNGDYTGDHNFEEDSERPWVCNDYNVGPYKYNIAIEKNGFSVFPSFDIGAVSFGLYAPDGTGLGYHALASETAGQKFDTEVLSSDSAYDGLLVSNQSAEEDKTGYFWVSQDSFRGVIRPLSVDNFVEVVSTEGYMGVENVPVEICVKNDVDISAVDIKLSYDPQYLSFTPEEITDPIGTGAVAPTERSDGYEQHSAIIDPDAGTIQIIGLQNLLTPGNPPISAGEYAIYVIKFDVTDICPLPPDDIVTDISIITADISDESGDLVEPLDLINGTFTVKTYMLGDCNKNVRIDIGDVVKVINCLLGLGDCPDPICLGDGNCNGRIDIGDAVKLINHLLDGTPIDPCTNIQTDLSDNLLKPSVDTPGSIAQVSLNRLEHPKMGFSFDVETETDVAGVFVKIGYDSDQLSIGTPALTQRTEDMTLEYNMTDSGMNIVIYSMEGKRIEPGNGSLLSIPVQPKEGTIHNDALGLTIDDISLADGMGRLIPIEGVNLSTSIDSSDKDAPLNMEFQLKQNYPNPFNPDTIVEFMIPSSHNNAYVQLHIYNLQGQLVRTLINTTMFAGFHSVIWDGKDVFGNEVSAGIYLYQLKVNDYVETKKMMLMR